MKFLLFGTGEYYKRYKKWFAKEDISALLDNSPEKQNTCLDGIPILSPEEGIKLTYDVVLILSFFVKEMREQLLRLGVAENNICHFYDLHRLIYKKEILKPVQYYGEAEKIIRSGNAAVKKMLLLSQDLELGGPAIALYHAAKILRDQGNRVIYVSMIDGPLRKRLLESDISVIVDVNLQIGTMRDINWIKGFDLIICNTLNFHIFLSERNVSVPVIWWLHDPAFFYEGVRKENMEKIDATDMEVCAVGPFPERAIHQYMPLLEVKRLLYGVADSNTQNREFCVAKRGNEGRICFVTIGYINSIKGQDILADAVKLMPEELRRKSIFYLVGQKTSPLAHMLEDEADKLPEIKMTGIVGRDKINEILNHADVLICPSREDAMPTVCAEAMMHGVPCLVSDAVGTAEYIEDGLSGLIFRSEDAEMLSEKIKWCIQNYEKLHGMGGQARKIYDQYFSMDVFERELMKLVNKCLYT